jgi:hypothetical protein
LTAPIVFLLASVLLAGLPAVASATAPEMRGEWELVVNTPTGPAKGTALISIEANSSGEFATNNVLFSGSVHGTFSGTLEGSEASVRVTTEASGSFLASEFTSTTAAVESSGSTLSMTGSGTFTYASQSVPATFVATRIKTYKQIEEQEAQEKKEQEEREARERVRGEWALTIESGGQVAKATALITKVANAKNEFASSSAFYESVIPGTFSGTLEGGEASVTVTSEAAGPYPASTFTATKVAVAFTSSSMTMNGSGTLSAGGGSFPATLTATRIKTNQEVEHEIKEREAKEREEREAREKAEREASEKAAREAKEKQDREALEAKQKAEREASEKAALQTREKAEREAREAAEKAALANAAKLVSVQLAGKALTVGASELLSLQITNPNPYAISGRVTLLLSARGGKSAAAKSGKSKSGGSLGSASFGVSPHGIQVVKLKLSQRGRAEVARHKTLHVLATVTTLASGKTTTSKTFSLTLHAAKVGHGKH